MAEGTAWGGVQLSRPYGDGYLGSKGYTLPPPSHFLRPRKACRGQNCQKHRICRARSGTEGLLFKSIQVGACCGGTEDCSKASGLSCSQWDEGPVPKHQVCRARSGTEDLVPKHQVGRAHPVGRKNSALPSPNTSLGTALF
jgi:hypothetical protein